MVVVIPAAGVGARFLPLSRFVPKELLLLGDRPLIHHALVEAARAEFDTAVVVLSPAKLVLRRYLQEVEMPLPVELVDQPEPAGLGNAVLRARALASPPFGVLLPDDVILSGEPWRLLRSAHDGAATAALCVRHVPAHLTSRFGIASCRLERGRMLVEQLVEKPAPGTAPSNLAVLGRYVVTEPVLTALEGGFRGESKELELTHGFAAVTAQPPGVVAVPFDGDVFDCGTPADYQHSVSRFPQPPRAG
jgi:UTP--glucose-1-phosphate uridylyltransferase